MLLYPGKSSKLIEKDYLIKIWKNYFSGKYFSILVAHILILIR